MHLSRLHNAGLPVELKLGGLDIVAFSISAVATYVMLPALDACFDLGHCPVEASHLRNVFLSHVHQDHAGGVHRHLSLRSMYRARPSRIYLPAESAPAMTDLLRAWERLEQKPEADLERVVRPVEAGDMIRLSSRFQVFAFDVTHRITSLGYTVIESRRTLRPAYADTPGPELGAARKRGEELYDYTEVPIFTYVGDATIETLRNNPHVGRSEVLFLEATHLPGTSREVSATWGHTHLDELVELHRDAPDTLASPHIVLKHFSTRYGRRQIEEAIGALPPELAARVTLLI
jgi:ribonuclease Z